ncbi:hypothetical protein ATL17_1596 [Maritalea mobilis]|uniref:Uncharacterized protein n=1 Tax=Maritalea mobilis TaxID=483324 RepID=A0A4R6VJ17_9HYPH|nr:hypothetical protein [Maritalea mobilis]TDQ63589.1 hypothetical protein ATL17_1596 [Maritalea mobilis]
MTPRDRAEKIVERFLSTPEGFAPDDKQALIAAIEQGMNEVLEDAAHVCERKARFLSQDAANTKSPVNRREKSMVSDWIQETGYQIRALKSPDTPRNTITDNQKD